MLKKLPQYNENQYAWISDNDQRIKGKFSIQLHYCPHQEVLQGYVHSLQINNKKHHGKGHGTMMMQELIREAIRLRVGELRLDVNRKNSAAIRLYYRAGFKKDLRSPINALRRAYDWRLLLRIVQQGEMSMKFKVGDVVQLNSGGPKMTVSFADEKEAVCRFFDGQGEHDKETFPVETIKKCLDKGPSKPKRRQAKTVGKIIPSFDDG